ncbi:MAG: hypothetical protein LBT55_08180 [Clostridiaceae bacterium]|jgi:hypothetical protein|nr:hypothetical protein [Clostridiaceae bacterium]
MNKKKIFAAAALMLTLIVSAFTLAGCNTKYSPEEAWELLASALQKSKEAPVYFWQEWWTEEGNADLEIPARNSYRDFEMLADRNQNSDLIFENGNPKNLVLKYYYSAGNTSREVFCGSSAGNNGTQQWLFEINTVGSKTDKTKRPQSPYEYIKTEAFAECDLDVLLFELSILRLEEVDFEMKKAVASSTGRVTNIAFGINEERRAEYLERYANVYPDGAPVFKNAARVEIEIAYGRVSAITCYRVQTDVPGLEFLNVDMEYYKLWIVYNGPNVTMPGYGDAGYVLQQ